jgi:hypothetical protein
MVGKGDAPAPREPEDEEEDNGGVVKLISAEGFEFVVDKKAAVVSNTLRNMLTSPGTISCFSFRFDSSTITLTSSDFPPSPSCQSSRRLLRVAPGRGPIPGDLHPHPREDLPVLLLVAPLLQVTLAA